MKVEWLILADAAQVVGNKLYMLGGGWDRIVVNRPFPVEQKLALALSMRVAWNETNQNQTFEIEVLSEDGTSEQPTSIMKVGGQFQVGRPAGMSAGQEQRFQLALETGLKFDGPGIKSVVARLNGNEEERVQFTVMAGPTTVMKG